MIGLILRSLDMNFMSFQVHSTLPSAEPRVTKLQSTPEVEFFAADGF